jgi:peptide/nickel transport system substrate-binding protein
VTDPERFDDVRGAVPLPRRRLLGLLGTGAAATSVGLSRRVFADGSPSGSGPPRSGGEIRVATWDEPISLDPANTAVAGLNPVRLMFDTLVTQRADSTPAPGVAESWAISADGRAYTFKLKEHVRFQDGTPVDAQAVKFTLDRATSPQAKANFTISLDGIYQAADVRDELTVRIVLTAPYAPLLDALATGYYAIVSPTAVTKYGRDFDRQPVGSGPYRLREWAPKSHVTLERNDRYAWGAPVFKHRAAPYPDQLTFRLVPDAPTRLATLETGEVHAAEEIPPDDVEWVSKRPTLRVLRQVVPGTSAQLMLNTTRPPLDDVRVRRAVLAAVNQDALTQILFRDALTPARTPLAPGTLGFDERLRASYRFDATRARTLLDEAGWNLGAAGLRVRNGQPLELSIHIVSTTIQALPAKVAEVIQAQLRDVGMTLSIKQMDTASLFALLRQGGQQIVLGWRGGTDPDVMRPLFHSAFFGKSPVARILFKDERLDHLLVSGAQELNRARRQVIYREAQEIVLRNALVVPLWNRHALVGTSSRLRDLALDAQGNLSLYDAWLAEA